MERDAILLSRITSDAAVLGGKPVIRGTRLSVEYILNLLGHGSTVADVLAEYQGLVAEDIQACLLFAGRALEDLAFVPLDLASAG